MNAAETAIAQMPNWMLAKKHREAMELYNKHSKPVIDLLSMTSLGDPLLVYEEFNAETGKKFHKIVTLESPAEAASKVQLREYLSELQRQCFKAVGYPDRGINPDNIAGYKVSIQDGRLAMQVLENKDVYLPPLDAL